MACVHLVNEWRRVRRDLCAVYTRLRFLLIASLGRAGGRVAAEKTLNTVLISRSRAKRARAQGFCTHGTAMRHTH